MDEFIERCKIAVELQKEGVLGVNTDSVQLRDECFFAKFPIYKTSFKSGEYPIKHSTVVDGIEFFCITKLTAEDIEIISKKYEPMVEEIGGTKG